MTGLQAKAEQAADLLIEIARDASRRGVIAETVLASDLPRLALAEVVEALVHRASEAPNDADSPISQQLRVSYLSDTPSRAGR